MSPDIADQPGRPGRADTVQLLQPAAGGLDQVLELLVGRLDRREARN